MANFMKLVGKLAFVGAVLAGIMGYVHMREMRKELEN